MYSHSYALPRFSFSFVAAFVTTVGLFLIMMDLIRMRGDVPEKAPPTIITDIYREIEDKPIEEDKIEPPPPVIPPPPTVIPPTGIDPDTITIGTLFNPPKLDTSTNIGLETLPDGDMLPIVAVSPVYPPRARERNIQGYVLVEFTVDAAGRVTEPRVIDAKPTGMFDRSALRAVTRFKYKPRVENGIPVPVDGVTYRVTYHLE